MAYLSVRGLSLEYPISSRVGRAPQRRSALSIGSMLSRIGGSTVVRALDQISFDLVDGDRLALVGANGSGKSSLLMALAGIFEPKTGQVVSEGRIQALFNVRLGFRMEATGRRNVLLRGLLDGWSRRDIAERMDEIIAFSDLEDYIDLPMHTYSQGMAARLAFAAATSIRPDILLLDEWIGAGDRAFQRKAKKRMESIVSDAGIVVMASHNDSLLRSICNKALLLRQGRVERFGEIGDVLAATDR